MSPLDRASLAAATAVEVRWWLKERLKKFRELSHDTMAVNPFMAPVVMALHSHTDASQLAELLLGGHFMTGHSTGFGKLVDEKLLPRVFGTTKLDKKRRKTEPYGKAAFDEVDHVVGFDTDAATMLSLKSSRWTIQLTMAVQLNHAFTKLLELRAAGEVRFAKIVVGVIYGTAEAMTDKYEIIRGVRSGADHSVTDIRDHVEIRTGREFWAWVNGGEAATQEWVLEGILNAVDESKAELSRAAGHLEAYKAKFAETLAAERTGDGAIDWASFLRRVNS